MIVPTDDVRLTSRRIKPSRRLAHTRMSLQGNALGRTSMWIPEAVPAVIGNSDEGPKPKRITFVLSPSSTFKSYWDWLVIMFVIYNSVVIPLDLAFPDQKEAKWKTIFEYIVDFLFLVDIAFSFRTAVFHLGQYVVEPKQIARRYLRTWFPLDFLASFPFELLAYLAGWKINLATLGLLRCPRLLRLGRLFKKLDQLAAANAFRILKLLFLFLLIAHWVACFWLVVGSSDHNLTAHSLYEGGAWVSRFDESMDTGFRYSVSLYWALTTLLKTPMFPPSTLDEVLFASFCLILGAVIFATIFGNVTILLQSFDKSGEQYRVNMAHLNAFIKVHELSDDLTRQLLQYTDANLDLQEETAGDTVSVISHLPLCVKHNLFGFIYRDLTKASPILTSCPPKCRNAMLTAMKVQVFLPGDPIVDGSLPLSTLFILVRGTASLQMASESEAQSRKASVVTRANAAKGVTVQLSRGSVAGPFDHPRRTGFSVTLQPEGKCLVAVISSDILASLMNSYPAEMHALLEKARVRGEVPAKDKGGASRTFETVQEVAEEEPPDTPETPVREVSFLTSSRGARRSTSPRNSDSPGPSRDGLGGGGGGGGGDPVEIHRLNMRVERLEEKLDLVLTSLQRLTSTRHNSGIGSVVDLDAASSASSALPPSFPTMADETARYGRVLH